MLTHPTIDLLRALKLDGMAEAFVELQSQDRAKELDHAEWLALLLDREAANRGTDRLTANQRRDLMEIVEDRYGAGSTLITSQLPVETWHEVIGEPTFADAILDRIVHNAHRLALDGPSMRDPKTAKASVADTTSSTAATKPATGTKK